jgi:hypothetical protein
MRRYITAAVVLTLIALGFRLYLTLHLPNDDDDDGRYYSLLARNLLDHRGYSGETEEPFVPTYVRAPGYPLFLAAAYYAFGRVNDRAVRVIQATADTATCWLIALLALAWSPAEWYLARRRRAMLMALALAAACPFTAIFVATILTETCATFLVTAFALVATLALKSERFARAALLWLTAGLLGGAATMCRPDCALFVGGAGVMLIVAALLRAHGGGSQSSDRRQRERSRLVLAMFLSCIALSTGFSLVLAPWTIRNARVFGVFQPVAPQYANMPNESVAFGYVAWLRTWVDDERYVSPIEDSIDLYPIRIEQIPDYAFDSGEERDRVAALLERYNNPRKPVPTAEDDVSEPAPSVKMTPEIDAEFRRMAGERIARHPLLYYAGLPLERAVSLWFDTHSQYYPFQGQFFPLSDLDTDAHQQYWLALFALITWSYTAVGLIGAWAMWTTKSSRRWALLLVLLILPRLAFLASQEHPESRYTVEFFALVAAAGGVALAGFRLRRTHDPRRGDQDGAATPAGDV